MTPEEQAAERARLRGFLAKFLDPATTTEEASGAVVALVRRLRKWHEMGERFAWLELVTAEEREKLAALRAGRDEPAPTSGSGSGAASAPSVRKPGPSIRETVETVAPFAAKHFPSVAKVAPIAAEVAGIIEGLGGFDFFDKRPNTGNKDSSD